MSQLRRAALAACTFVCVSHALGAQTLHATLTRSFPHAGIGRQIAFSPDSRILATSSADGTITLRRVGDGATLRTIAHPGGATSVAFTRDGAMLVSGGYDSAVRV
jgi:WD40 repeat protein